MTKTTNKRNKELVKEIWQYSFHIWTDNGNDIWRLRSRGMV